MKTMVPIGSIGLALLMCVRCDGQMPPIPQAAAATNEPQSLALEVTLPLDAAYSIIFASTNGSNPANFYARQAFNGADVLMTNLDLGTRNYFYSIGVFSNGEPSTPSSVVSFSGWTGSAEVRAVVRGRTTLNGPWVKLFCEPVTNLSGCQFFESGIEIRKIYTARP